MKLYVAKEGLLGATGDRGKQIEEFLQKYFSTIQREILYTYKTKIGYFHRGWSGNYCQSTPGLIQVLKEEPRSNGEVALTISQVVKVFGRSFLNQAGLPLFLSTRLKSLVVKLRLEHIIVLDAKGSIIDVELFTSFKVEG